MPVFSLLAHPSTYVPCSTENMHEDHEYRDYWLAHFERHFDTVMKLALDEYGESARPKTEACKADFIALLHAIRANPRSVDPLDLFVLDQLRQDKLILHGLPDPFLHIKQRENDASLEVYPRVIAELDGHADARDALLMATEGVFAGNIFDLGAGATTKRFAKESPDFLKVRNEVGDSRPWLVDQFAPMADTLLAQHPDRSPRIKQLLFFTDNAGSDFVLGVLPFCRLLAKRGMRVVIAANRLPALNDMTIAETNALLPRLAALDPTLADLMKRGLIATVDSGGTAPLIDLRLVSADVNEVATTTDFLILEGMGRGLESNYEALFTTPVAKLAMIKEDIVARRHGGKLYDSVCRFDNAAVA